MRTFLILACLACLAPPALAQGLSQRPASCERVATAQYDNCSVVNHFRCTGESFAFWIETLDADAILMIELRNAAHGSMFVDYVGMGSSLTLSQTEAHPRDVIRTGSGSDQISGTFKLFGMSRPLSGNTSYGHAGETAEIAGEIFARISFAASVVFPPPVGDMGGSGTFLYSDRLDLLLEEEQRFDFSGAPADYRLARLSLPGQTGFGDETPDIGCGEMSLVPLHAPQVPA
jgi:hypothetical protein